VIHMCTFEISNVHGPQRARQKLMIVKELAPSASKAASPAVSGTPATV
jgi:hypothetical protein